MEINGVKERDNLLIECRDNLLIDESNKFSTLLSLL
jgi:hypothetical protein